MLALTIDFLEASPKRCVLLCFFVFSVSSFPECILKTGKYLSSSRDGSLRRCCSSDCCAQTGQCVSRSNIWCADSVHTLVWIHSITSHQDTGQISVAFLAQNCLVVCLHISNFAMGKARDLRRAAQHREQQTGEWIMFKAVDSGRPFFFNSLSGESSWQSPQKSRSATSTEQKCYEVIERGKQGDLKNLPLMIAGVEQANMLDSCQAAEPKTTPASPSEADGWKLRSYGVIAGPYWYNTKHGYITRSQPF